MAKKGTAYHDQYIFFKQQCSTMIKKLLCAKEDDRIDRYVYIILIKK